VFVCSINTSFSFGLYFSQGVGYLSRTKHIFLNVNDDRHDAMANIFLPRVVLGFGIEERLFCAL
jgi:hypothetical protein